MEVGDLGAAAEVVAGVGRPNAGILVDTLHFARSGSSLDQLSALPIGVVPVRPALRRPGRRSADRRRGHPRGAGGPFASRLRRSCRWRDWLERLPVVPYALEVPNDVLRQELGTADYARLVLATARELVADCGLTAVAN